MAKKLAVGRRKEAMAGKPSVTKRELVEADRKPRKPRPVKRPG